MISQKTVLITGCTPGGIGHSLALDFHSRNYTVIASARSASKIIDLKELGCITIDLDVTSLDSIKEARRRVERLIGEGRIGGVDVLVNNAGVNLTMPALDVDVDEARHCFETNFFSVVNMVQVFTPLLIKRKGLIVNIGSVAAIIPFAFGSIYNASKAAIHAYSRTLRLELEPLDVKVMVVVTGGVKSNIARTERKLPPSSYYLEINEEFQERVTYSQTSGAMPHEVYAKGVVDAVVNGGKRTLWRGNKVGRIWFVRNWLGSWVFDWILPGMFGLTRLARILRGRVGEGKRD